MSRNTGYVCSCAWIAYAAVTLALAVGVGASTEETCAEAKTRLSPCNPFMTGKSSNVPDQCCAGVSTLGTLLGTDPNMIIHVCRCLKQAAIEVGVKADLVTKVILECNVAINILYDPSIECNDASAYSTYTNTTS